MDWEESRHENQQEEQHDGVSSVKVFVGAFLAVVVIGGVFLCLEPVVGRMSKEASPYLDSLKAGAADLGSVREKHWWKDKTIYINADTGWFATDEEVSDYKDYEADMAEAMEHNRAVMEGWQEW